MPQTVVVEKLILVKEIAEEDERGPSQPSNKLAADAERAAADEERVEKEGGSDWELTGSGRVEERWRREAKKRVERSDRARTV